MAIELTTIALSSLRTKEDYVANKNLKPVAVEISKSYLVGVVLQPS